MYHVQFIEEGKTKDETYDCRNAGVAFAECLKKHPGAELIKAYQKSEVVKREFYVEYAPPPRTRAPLKPTHPHRAPRPNERDGIMPFYDEVVSKKDPKVR